MSDRLYYDTRASVRSPSMESQSTHVRPQAASRLTVKKQSGADASLILKRVLIAIIIALTVIVVAEIVFQVAIAQDLSIKTISIDSDLSIDHQAFLAGLGIQEGSRFYGFDDVWLKDKLLELPQVGMVKVEKVFPDTLSLLLRARKAIVRSFAVAEDGRQKMVLIDDKGVVFDWAGKTHLNLPLLSGIEFRNFRFGLVLPSMLFQFFSDLQSLKSEKPAVFAAFSEFRLMPTQSDGLELLAWTMMSPVPVRIGPALKPDNSVMMLRVLSLLGTKIDDTNLRELDFRSPNLVLKRGAD